MNQPDWRDFRSKTEYSANRPRIGSRIVLWLPTDRDASFQYWERIANVARGGRHGRSRPVHDRGHLDSGPTAGRGPRRPALESPAASEATPRTFCFPTAHPPNNAANDETT